MFCFSNLCYMCLKTYKNLTTVLIENNEDIQKKLKYCLPEIVDSHLEIPKFICNNCISKLDCFYQFKQWCLQNNKHLNNYLQLLTSAGEKYKHLAVELTDIKYQNNLQEVNTNQTLPIIGSHDELKTEGKEDHGIYIKEEESIFTIEIKCAEKLNSIFDKEDIVVKEKCASEDYVNIEFVRNKTLPIVGSGEKEDIATHIKEETGIKRDEEKDIVVKEECASEDYINIEFVKNTTCNNETLPIIGSGEKEDITTHIKEETGIMRDEEKDMIVKEECATEDNINIEIVKNTTCNYETLPIVGSGEKEDILTHIKEETGITRDNEEKDMIVKEECVTSEDTADIEFYNEYVKNTKCESVSGDSVISISDTEDLDDATIKEKAKKTFECAICNKEYSSKVSLQYHFQVHSNIKHFSFSTRVKKTHTEIKSFKCKVCNKIFKSNRYLVRHSMLHTGIKQFECSICNKKFAQKHGLTGHEIIHTGIKNFECTICKKKFLRKTELTKHEAHHAGKKYKCSICSKEFTRKDSLNAHEISHKGVKNYECNICKTKFMRQKSLAIHVKTHTGINVHECKVCNKKFMQRWLLIDHEKVHSGVKNYECSTCKKTFYRKINLIVHQKKHSGVKNYQCSTCKKKFVHKATLNRHELIHTGTKKYECPICNKKFLQNCTLTRHKKNVHDLNEAESR